MSELEPNQNSKPNIINEYTDEEMNVHYVDETKILGQGGQGVVYRSENPNIAIKFSLNSNNHQKIDNKDEIEKFHNSIKKLQLLQIPNDVNISIPLTMLKDEAGYVMKLLNSASSLEDFLENNKKLKNFANFDITENDITQGLIKKLTSSDGSEKYEFGKIDVLSKFCYLGGLRLRTIALGKTAALLSRIHGQGLVYGDVSSKNVFYLADNDENCTIWFIDPDNLDYEQKRGITVYTPEYGAPELVQKNENGQSIDGVRTVSDCHAFCVLASLVMTWTHPFKGDLIIRGDDWSTGDELEDAALAGRYPWIDDPNDDSNKETQNNRVFPRKILFTPLLQKLLELTFCDGRIKPYARPTIYHWVRAFLQAHDLTVKCPKCGMSLYYYNLQKVYKCERCDNNDPDQLFLMFKAYRLTKKGRFKNYEWAWVHEIDAKKDNKKIISIPQRVFAPFDCRHFDEEFLTIKIDFESKFLTIQKNMYVNDKLLVAIKSKNGKFSVIEHKKYVYDISTAMNEDNIWLMNTTSNGYSRLISLSIKGNK